MIIRTDGSKDRPIILLVDISVKNLIELAYLVIKIDLSLK